jgi:triacylglycerol lipase
MYFPKAFDVERAIQLGELIKQAYAQFASFENERQWKLSDGYSLAGEFSYVWTPNRTIEKGIRRFDVVLDRIRSTPKRNEIRVPIGFAASKRKCFYLVFRGTQTVKEWIRNFGIALNPYLLPSFGNVHDGFLQTYSSVRDEVSASLSERKGTDRLFIAGHSLGAAIATLAAPDIEKNFGLKVEAVYTFGSPRVGDDAFVRAFNGAMESRSFRITNTSDIVTSIPLPAPVAGRIGGYFSHVDTPIDMTVQEDDLEKNHSMKTYLSELGKNKEVKGLLKLLQTKRGA